jgi:DNA-binding transcriptional MerR regulator
MGLIMKGIGRILRIGDVARITRMSIHTLRYWERMFGEILSPCRSGGGQRRYGEKDIEKILEVKRLLKEEGYSINGAKKVLSNSKREEELALYYRRREFDWSHIAQEVTELIRKKLSKGISQV